MNADRDPPPLESTEAKERRAADLHARLIYARRAYWLAVAILVSILLVTGWRWIDFHGADGHQATDLVTGIDPNTADWAELALLPGLGGSVAKRIVAYREKQRARLGPDATVFKKPADLLPVNGIGARMLRKIQASLRFPNDAAGEFDSPSGGG